MLVLSCINHYYQRKPCPNSRSAAVSSLAVTLQIYERTQQTSDVFHLIIWGILVKTRPLQKNANPVHARGTFCTCVVASSWMCVDMVPFYLYLFIWCWRKFMTSLLSLSSRIDRQFTNAWKVRTSRPFLDSGSDTKFQLISINEETRVPIKCPNCAFRFLFLAQQPPSGPGPPHSRGF